jgi:hypothetical protein
MGLMMVSNCYYSWLMRPITVSNGDEWLRDHPT